MRHSNRTSRPIRWRLIAGIMLFDVGLFFAVAAYMLRSKPNADTLIPISSNGRVIYEVPERTSASFLIQDLTAKKLIRFPFAFKTFLALTGQDRRIRAGFYSLPLRSSAVELARLLTSGKMATQSVTMPEGKAAWEIFGILRKVFPLDSLLFDSLVRAPDFARSVGIEAPGLEGYLFPDTYVLPYRVSEQMVLTFLAKRFLEVSASMPMGEGLGSKSIHGWVTLASIVEKEAAVKKEQGLIAGVFQNRLRLGWPLGADPTVRYALRKLTGPLHVSELNMDSPYNTRRFPGLPPGPICNPGRGALLAALTPQKTEMMFFVAKDDGSREHYFSTTNFEHNQFKILASKNRGE